MPCAVNISANLGSISLATERAISKDSAVLHVPRRCVLLFSKIRKALSKSASSSTYTWQLPSKCLITGMRASLLMRSIKPLPPRGTITSTYCFMVINSPTAARSVVSTTCTAVVGKPAACKPSCTNLAKAWLQLIASLPPRKIAALPDLMHRPAASTVTFGRAS